MPRTKTTESGSASAVGPRRGAPITCTITNLADSSNEDVERSLLALCDDLAALALARYLAEEEDADADADQSRDLRPLLDGPAGR